MNSCNLIVLGTILLHSERTVNKSVMKANEFNRAFQVVHDCIFLGYFAFLGFSLKDAQTASLCPFSFLLLALISLGNY